MAYNRNTQKGASKNNMKKNKDQDKNLSKKPAQIKYKIVKQNKSKQIKSWAGESKSGREKTNYNIDYNNKNRKLAWQLRKQKMPMPQISIITGINIKTLRSQKQEDTKNKYPIIKERFEELLKLRGEDQGSAKSIYKKINLILKYNKDPLLDVLIKNLSVEFNYKKNRTYISGLSEIIFMKVSQQNQNQQSQMSDVNYQNILTNDSNSSIEQDLSEPQNQGFRQNQDSSHLTTNQREDSQQIYPENQNHQNENFFDVNATSKKQNKDQDNNKFCDECLQDNSYSGNYYNEINEAWY